MKGSKSKAGKIPAAAPEEECGVWLDAAELRTKKQKKRQIRPISKLLNPLARSGGYSMAVALNFTQTKMEMPATKQSTISAFFQPRSKMSKNTEDCSPHPVESFSALRTEVHMGTKRKRVVTTESPLEPDNKETSHISQVHPLECEEDLQSESDENFTDQTKEQDFFHLIWGYESEELEPAQKRRPTDDDYTESETEMQKECKKAIFHGIQDIPDTLLHSDQGHEDSHEDYQDSVRAHHLLMDKNISRQKPVLTTRSVRENPGEHIVKHPHKPLELPKQKHFIHTQWSPVKRKDKENSGPTSPTHTTAGSPLKHLTISSQAKRFSDFEKPSIFHKGRHHQSPMKSIKQSLENERDSFAMLFTQDSEGFRVIANRSKPTRCPLKDRTNSTENRENWNLPSAKSLETEDSDDSEPEMLFTQDSQGNTVIKH